MSGQRRRAAMVVGPAVAALVAGALWLANDDGARARHAAADPRSISWVCDHHSDRVRQLFESLDLDRDGLEAVRGHVDARRWREACAEMVTYYRTGKSGDWLRVQARPRTAGGGRRHERAEKVLADSVFVGWVYDRVPRREEGGLDWSHGGPADDRSWASLLNFLDFLRAPLDAYRRTGEARFAERLDEHVRDWIVSNPYPGRRTRTPQWGGLQAAERARVFAEVFYALQDAESFSPAARILLLSSVAEHGDYLRRFHFAGGNRLANEMTGLAVIAAAWPELSASDEWLDYAAAEMSRQVGEQVYPDGVQMELSSHYHRITANHYQSLMETLERAGRRADFADRLEAMWDYIAFTMRPSGYGVVNNDSYENFTRPRILGLAPSYGREDWVHIATNGERGTAPRRGPSVVFPWAGQVVMRSGWDGDAMWAFFDTGPAGQAHQHEDKLHLSVSAFGRDLLSDNGFFRYKPDEWRTYFQSSAAHNVVLVDGAGQLRGRTHADAPMARDRWAVTDDLDFARGRFDAGFVGIDGTASHTRAVLHVRGRFWVVVDRIETDRPRALRALWHFNPECAVELDSLDAVSTDEGVGNLRIVPVSAMAWYPVLVRGRGAPGIQGWHSRKPNQREPQWVAVYDGRIESSTTFAWLLVPAPGAVPAVDARATALQAEGAELVVSIDGRTDVVYVPLTGADASVRRVE